MGGAVGIPGGPDADDRGPDAGRGYGVVIGRRLGGVLSERVFRLIFRAILAVLVVKFAWDGLVGLGGF